MSTKPLKHLLLFLLYGVLAIVIAVVVAYASGLRSHGELAPWHTVRLDREFVAGGSGDTRTLDDYRRIEDAVFAQLSREVYGAVEPSLQRVANRYAAGSRADPNRAPTNWNKTFELSADPARGAALLLHGMSDSPYSLRAIGEDLNGLGFQVLGLRLPGHGTTPAGLVHADWQDFAAATRLGARYLRARLPPDRPLYIVGYSNGAALAVEYALARLQGEDLPEPQGLILLSPAIGVSPVAALATWQSRLSRLPGLGVLGWTSLAPEYDPYKYQSFAVNAGVQVHALTQVIDRRMTQLAAAGRTAEIPPILAFQSIADATVSAPALVRVLFNRLQGASSQLVAFDVNRHAEVDALFLPDAAPGVEPLLHQSMLPFDLTLLTNASSRSSAIVSLRRRPGAGDPARTETDLVWPVGMFSLSHVAVPFAPDDPVYGANRPEEPELLYLGRMEALGEKGLLAVPAADLFRLRFNPFFPYVRQRIREFVAAGAPHGPPAVVAPMPKPPASVSSDSRPAR